MHPNLSDLPADAQNRLVASARDGNGEAFDTLSASFGPLIQSYINSFGVSPSERDDLYQEGLIGLLKAVRTYDYESSAFATYASVCIKRSIITAVRKLNRAGRFEYAADSAAAAEQAVKSPEHTLVDLTSSKELFDSFMSSLSPFERRVFKSYLRGSSYKRMAAEFNRAEKSIDNAMTRIRSKLKKQLK